ncbi:MAG: PilZ domain-containing protein [Candidatus Omnitrophota bacterium]
MEKYTGAERRKFPRANANFVVSYRVKEHGTYDLSQTKNISQGGLLITTNKKFENGTQLIMTIRFPFVEQKIEIIGEVIDSKEIVKGLIYETRLRFTDLPADFFKELGIYIKELLEKWSKR